MISKARFLQIAREKGEFLMNIQSLPVTQRPRERGWTRGVSELTSEELLALVIRSGSNGEHALHLAGRVLEQFQFSLRVLHQASFQELVEIKGIGPCKALQIQAIGELARRHSTSPVAIGETVESSYSVFRHLKERLIIESQEQVWALLLDIKKQMIGEFLVSKGSIDITSIEPREVFLPAVRRGAHGVIVVHNHPSGDPTPSPEDVKVTELLRKAGILLGIRLLDHLIIASRGFFSFSDGKIYLKEPS